MNITMLDYADGGVDIGKIYVNKDGPMFGYTNAWLVAFCVEPHDQMEQIRRQLYDTAEKMALDAGCRLIPSPDLWWEEFDFWRETDAEALRNVLTHADAKSYLDFVGGDEECFRNQLKMLEA